MPGKLTRLLVRVAKRLQITAPRPQPLSPLQSHRVVRAQRKKAMEEGKRPEQACSRPEFQAAVPYDPALGSLTTWPPPLPARAIMSWRPLVAGSGQNRRCCHQLVGACVDWRVASGPRGSPSRGLGVCGGNGRAAGRGRSGDAEGS